MKHSIKEVKAADGYSHDGVVVTGARGEDIHFLSSPSWMEGVDPKLVEEARCIVKAYRAAWALDAMLGIVAGADARLAASDRKKMEQLVSALLDAGRDIASEVPFVALAGGPGAASLSPVGGSMVGAAAQPASVRPWWARISDSALLAGLSRLVRG
jgi:hypothetical protein